MRKLAVIFILLFGCIGTLSAKHMKGGEMYYDYLGVDPNNSSLFRYRISLKLYLDCGSTGGQLEDAEPLTIYDKSTNAFVQNLSASLSSEFRLSFDPTSNPCISNAPPDVCYLVRVYTKEVSLPISPQGYVISFQRCCRIENIINLANSEQDGATYFCEIPGTNVLPEAYKNSSLRFSSNDAVALCAGSSFSIDYSATDPDGTDEIVYQLCNGFTGGSQSTPAPQTASQPPYTELDYQLPYSGGSPLGAEASINSSTGLLSGIAPTTIGQYVITVCAYEYREGQLIDIHRKDIHVKVSDCIPLTALLDPTFSYCKSYTVDFQNKQANPPGSVYTWDFGDGTVLSSNDVYGSIQHQYTSAGTYTIKVEVNLAGQCVDNTTATLDLYPGYFPGFESEGTCLLIPIQFTDTTKANFGAADKWTWNFGDETTQADTSHLQAPSWKYSSTGIKTVQLIVESDKGCIDTVSNDIEVRDKPLIDLAFKDTLICSVDDLQLQATGQGVFSWSPNYNITNQNTSAPIVSPDVTTTYYVTLNENGCINDDSVNVNVVDRVTLDAGPDTTICLTDSLTLEPSGDGLRYEWSPAATLDDPTAKNPVAVPVDPVTIYHAIAYIGSCSAEDDVTIKAVPYPQAEIGADTTICYADTAQINGRIQGTNFYWTPVTDLSDPNSVSPKAYPLTTTAYVLTVYDESSECAKPWRDTIVIFVTPQIFADAGNDTSVVVGQPLQLHGSGSDFYTWSPATGLNRADTADPVAILNDHITYIMRTYTALGCDDYDTINIRVFKTQPDIFVPNAFTPGKTSNGRFRPIPVGVVSIDYFRVYNRWGQLVYNSTQTWGGWDGTIGGKLQSSGTFVWMVQGKDYNGRTITKKGTVTLIR